MDSIFVTLLLFGIVMVLIRFGRGFYPYGSISRLTFGLACAPVMTLLAWQILMGSGVEAAFATNGFDMEMEVLMLPALMYISFIVVFELSEFIDGRREFRRWIGVPVEPFKPREMYHRWDDFHLFYASFRTGTRRGRLVVYKYAFEIVLFTVLASAALFLISYEGDLGSLERVRAALDPVTVNSFADSMIFLLLVLAAVNTSSVFIAWSYREGSFSRLVMSIVVAGFASQWAYYFWSSLAKIFSETDIQRVIYSIMFASFGLIILTMSRQLYKGFLKSRNKYVDWRLAELRKESGEIVPAGPTQVPTPFRMPTGVFAKDVLGIKTDPRIIAARAEGPRPTVKLPAGATFSFDISFEEQVASYKQAKK